MTNMTQSIPDSTMMGIVVSLMFLMLGIIGFFVVRWMNKTDEREQTSLKVISNINDTLYNLNTTILKVNNSLDLYQAVTNITINHIKEQVELHSKKIDKLDENVEEYMVRLTGLEKKSSNENTNR